MDEEQRFAFDTWGFLTVEDALTSTQVAALKATVEEQGVKVGAIMMPTRAAVSGQLNGPGVYDIMQVIGKEKTLARLEKAAKAV